MCLIMFCKIHNDIEKDCLNSLVDEILFQILLKYNSEVNLILITKKNLVIIPSLQSFKLQSYLILSIKKIKKNIRFIVNNKILRIKNKVLCYLSQL